jgi:hypothetical protein
MKHRIMTMVRKHREERDRKTANAKGWDGGECMQIWDIYSRVRPKSKRLVRH